MDNKKVGLLLLGVSLLIILMIILFNNALNDIVNTSCSMAGHGDSCPMYNTISKQTYLSFGIASLVILIALILIFSKPQEKIIIRKIKEKKVEKKIDVSELKPEEKTVLKLIQENKAVFQADLIEKTGFGKAKMTRVIDRLEGRGFVERKRRGMTNIVVLKE